MNKHEKSTFGAGKNTFVEKATMIICCSPPPIITSGAYVDFPNQNRISKCKFSRNLDF